MQDLKSRVLYIVLMYYWKLQYENKSSLQYVLLCLFTSLGKVYKLDNVTQAG